MDYWFIQMPIAGVGEQADLPIPPGMILGRILSGLIPCMSPHLLPQGTGSGFAGSRCSCRGRLLELSTPLTLHCSKIQSLHLDLLRSDEIVGSVLKQLSVMCTLANLAKISIQERERPGGYVSVFLLWVQSPLVVNQFDKHS